MQNTGELGTRNAAPTAVLLVGDSEKGLRALEKHLHGPFCSVLATTKDEALALVSNGHAVVGAIINSELADATGIEVAEALRKRFPKLPILLVCGQVDPDHINRAQLAAVGYVVRPHVQANLRVFAKRLVAATVRHLDSSDEVDETLVQLARQKHLSTREMQILAIAATGIPRSQIATCLGTSENTVKSQIRSLLEKTEKSNLSEVVWLVRAPLAPSH